MKPVSFSTQATWLATTAVIVNFGLAGPDARANDRAWQVLSNFPASVGPAAGTPLLEVASGHYYGMTGIGGSNNFGDLFAITPAGVSTEIYSFTNGTDGNNPVGGLTAGGDGYLYGVTLAGGSNGVGRFLKSRPVER